MSDKLYTSVLWVVLRFFWAKPRNGNKGIGDNNDSDNILSIEVSVDEMLDAGTS